MNDILMAIVCPPIATSRVSFNDFPSGAIDPVIDLVESDRPEGRPSS